MSAAMKAISGAFLLLGLSACETVSPSGAAGVGETQADQTLAFAQAACGGCHAVERFAISPNPDSPPFAQIANTSGLSADTLSAWLQDAHNYPQEMDFDLDRPQVEALVDYILTLKDPDYRPIVG